MCDAVPDYRTAVVTQSPVRGVRPRLIIALRNGHDDTHDDAGGPTFFVNSRGNSVT